MNTPSFLITTHDHVIAIAREAGALIRYAYDRPREIEYKGEVNLVTDTDRQSEALIKSRLAALFPTHQVLAEEENRLVPLTDSPAEPFIWYIDPLDGTNNFAHGFPAFCVSIALHDESGPLVGVVYDPLRDECFSAIHGAGARLNGRLIHVSDAPTIEQALVITGFPYDRVTAELNNVEAVAVFIRRVQGLRRTGSAALDLCYVACGRADAYWERGVKPWDIGAAMLLVTEAGGAISDYWGDDAYPAFFTSERITASNKLLHAQMVQTLKSIYPVKK